jgi:putative toxin-antitoxin system antitoxin component (TIGR02293 family)
MTTLAELDKLDIEDPLALDSVARTGISSQVAIALGQRFQISQDSLAELISIPKRTLHRKLAREETLKPDESERVLRIGKLYRRALQVFEDPERATKWFSSKPKALAGKTPLELMKTEFGARLVEDLLGRIEHGVFS